MSKSELVTIIMDDINTMERRIHRYESGGFGWYMPQEKIDNMAIRAEQLRDVLKYVELLDSLE